MKEVSVFCIFRDSEKSLSQLFCQLEELERLPEYNFSYFFYENDSKDKTRILLEEWTKERKGGFLFEDLAATKFGSVVDPARMRLLCSCRNKSKELAGQNNTDYSLIIDSDIKFSAENFKTQVSFLEFLDDAVMITPNVRQSIPDFTFGNTADSYYDVYAFRSNNGNNGLYFSDCPSFLKEDQELWANGFPIKVLSAFGGFAVLKSDVFNKVKWSADVNCDHCNMCFEISRFGQIYVVPSSTVFVSLEEETLDIESFKEMGKRQKEYYEYIWNGQNK